MQPSQLFTVTLLTLLLLKIAAQPISLPQKKEKQSYYIVNASNFESFVQNRAETNIFVEFVSENCLGCTRAESQFTEAGIKSASWGVSFVKVEIKADEDAAVIKEKYNIRRTPEFRLLMNGTQQVYFGNMQQPDDLINWLHKKLHGSINVVKSQHDFNSQTINNKVLVVYLGDPSSIQYVRMFQVIANRHNQAMFIRVEQGSPLESSLNGNITLEQLPAVILFRDYATVQKPAIFGKTWSVKNLEQWIIQYSAPPVSQYNDPFSFNMIDYQIPTLFLLRHKKDRQHQQLEEQFIEVANEIRDIDPNSSFMFALCDFTVSVEHSFFNIIGMTQRDMPALVLVIPTITRVQKYVMHENDLRQAINTNRIMNYLQLFKRDEDGDQPKVEDNIDEITQQGENLYTIKGSKSFHEFIKQDKDVLVLFHAYYCRKSLAFMETFDSVADEYKDMHKLMVFGKIDSVKNDVAGYQKVGFPNVIIFRKGIKDQPLTFNIDRDGATLKDFVKEQAVTIPLRDEHKVYKARHSSDYEDEL